MPPSERFRRPRAVRSSTPVTPYPALGCASAQSRKTFVRTAGADRRQMTIGGYPIVSLTGTRDKAKPILAGQLGTLHKPFPAFGMTSARSRSLGWDFYRPDKSGGRHLPHVFIDG